MTPSDKITAVLQGVKELADKAPMETHHDWTEDFSHENGNYNCKCLHCGCIFVGHKRRVQCKACSFIAASRDMLPRLVKALEHEMETSKTLANCFEQWPIAQRKEWLGVRRAELAAILTGDKP